MSTDLLSIAPAPAAPTTSSSVATAATPGDAQAFGRAIERAAQRQRNDAKRSDNKAPNAENSPNAKAAKNTKNASSSNATTGETTTTDTADAADATTTVEQVPADVALAAAMALAATLGGTVETEVVATDAPAAVTLDTFGTTEAPLLGAPVLADAAPAETVASTELTEVLTAPETTVPAAIAAVDVPTDTGIDGDVDAAPTTAPSELGQPTTSAPHTAAAPQHAAPTLTDIATDAPVIGEQSASVTPIVHDDAAADSELTEVAATDDGANEPTAPAANAAAVSPLHSTKVAAHAPVERPDFSANAAQAANEVRLDELEARLAEHGPNGPKILGAARLLRGGPGAPSTLTLNLDPASLGKIRVELTMHEGQMAVNLMAEKAQAVQAINGQMNQLRDALQHEGLQLSQLQVDLSNQGMQQRQGTENGTSSDRTNRLTNGVGAADGVEETAAAVTTRTIDENALVDVDL